MTSQTGRPVFLVLKHPIMRSVTYSLVILFAFALAGCGKQESSGVEESSAEDQHVAASELYSLADDFRLWDLLDDQGIANDTVRSHVANSMIRHLVTLRVVEYEISELKGMPTEALCRATTNETREILTTYGHEDVQAVALSYIDVVAPVILAEVERIQENMLGQGCFLSPRDNW